MPGIKFKPDGYRVMIRREASLEKSEGGIVLPDNSKKDQLQGEIVAVGAGLILENGDLRPPNFNVGDKVIFEDYKGSEIEVDGETFVIMNAGDVFGTLLDKVEGE